jgi:type II secretory pathway pseudopilin PulG
MCSRERAGQSGFTLIEVLFILWAFSLIAVYRYTDWQEMMERRAAYRVAANMETLGEMARYYKQQHGSWPDSPEAAANALAMTGTLNNRNPFGSPYSYEQHQHGAGLTISTWADLPSQALSICRRHVGASCSGKRISLAVSNSNIRAGDIFITRLLSGSQKDLQMHGQQLLNIGAINSEHAGTLDLRLADKPGASQLALYSIDAGEIIVDDLFAEVIDDLDKTYERYTQESVGDRRNEQVQRDNRYRLFPQSRYPLKWW